MKTVKEMAKGIENLLHSEKQKKLEELLKEYTDAYPRLHSKPEQKHLLEQMLKMYVHIEYDLWPRAQELFDKNLPQYRWIMNLLIKALQQWDRDMSKLGFTFTSQPYLPVDDRKTFNPKAVVRLQERVQEIADSLKEQQEETTDTPREPLPKLVAKKKEKKENGNQS